MCRTTSLSTPTSSLTCAPRSSGSRRRSQSRRVGSSTQSGPTSATSRVNPHHPHCFLWPAASNSSTELFPTVCHLFSGSPGPLQPAEPSRDGSAEGAAPGSFPPADGDQEEPDGAGEQQHGDPDRHVQTPSHHHRVSIWKIHSLSSNIITAGVR